MKNHFLSHYYRITTVPAVHHSLPEKHHTPGSEVVREADLGVAGVHGVGDFQSGHSARLVDHTVPLPSLHNGLTGSLEMRRIRQHYCRREEGCIVGMVGEGGQTRSLAGVGFHRKMVVVVDYRHMKVVAGLKVVFRMVVVGLKAVVRMVVVGLKVAARMVAVGLKVVARMVAVGLKVVVPTRFVDSNVVARTEVVDGLEADRTSALVCRMIEMEGDCSGWHKGRLKMVGCMRHDPPRLVDRK